MRASRGARARCFTACGVALGAPRPSGVSERRRSGDVSDSSDVGSPGPRTRSTPQSPRDADGRARSGALRRQYKSCRVELLLVSKCLRGVHDARDTESHRTHSAAQLTSLRHSQSHWHWTAHWCSLSLTHWHCAVAHCRVPRRAATVQRLGRRRGSQSHVAAHTLFLHQGSGPYTGQGTGPAPSGGQRTADSARAAARPPPPMPMGGRARVPVSRAPPLWERDRSGVFDSSWHRTSSE